MENSGWEGGKNTGGGERRRSRRNHQTKAGPEGAADTKKNGKKEKAKDRPRAGATCLDEKDA
jgi:hypothetical protein